jgi:peptide/nickel transport system permease protein
MINVLALHIAFLLTGVVAIEVLFQYPGLGRLLLEGVSERDIPLVQATALVMGAAFVLINLVADIALALLDPRIGARTA